MPCQALARNAQPRVDTKTLENGRLVVRSGFAEANVHADERRPVNYGDPMVGEPSRLAGTQGCGTVVIAIAMDGVYRHDLVMSRVSEDHHARSAGATDAKQKSVLRNSASGGDLAHTPSASPTYPARHACTKPCPSVQDRPVVYCWSTMVLGVTRHQRRVLWMVDASRHYGRGQQPPPDDLVRLLPRLVTASGGMSAIDRDRPDARRGRGPDSRPAVDVGCTVPTQRTLRAWVIGADWRPGVGPDKASGEVNPSTGRELPSAPPRLRRHDPQGGRLLCLHDCKNSLPEVTWQERRFVAHEPFDFLDRDLASTEARDDLST